MLCDLHHLPFQVGDLLQADLVDLVGRQARRGVEARQGGVALGPVGQRPDPGVGPSLGRVLVLHEGREAGVGGEHSLSDGREARGAEPDPVALGERAGELREGMGEGRRFGADPRHALGLDDDLFEEEARRHQARRHSVPHVGHGHAQDPGQLPQAGDVVLVVLHAVEGERRQELAEGEVGAADLRHRHEPSTEPRVVQGLPEVAHHQRPVEGLLLREIRGVHGLEAVQELLRLREVRSDGRLGEVAQLVVPALVAEDGGDLGVARKRVLPVLGQEVGQGLPAGGKVGGGLGKDHGQREYQGGKAQTTVPSGMTPFFGTITMPSRM